MSTSNSSNAQISKKGTFDTLVSGASDIAASASEKLQAVKDIWKTVVTTNETFQKAVDSNQAVADKFFLAAEEAIKSAETAEERERLLRMAQDTVKTATAASENISDKALELGKGAVMVLGVIAAGTVAIICASQKRN